MIRTFRFDCAQVNDLKNKKRTTANLRKLSGFYKFAISKTVNLKSL